MFVILAFSSQNSGTEPEALTLRHLRKEFAMNLKHNSLVLMGAAIGGLLGYAAFFWIVRQGFYGLILPGGLLGIGAGLFKTRSKYVAVICGFLALALGCFT